MKDQLKEKIVKLDRFVPRFYQMQFIEAFEKHEFKRYLLVWARRAGKDVCAFNLIFRAALRQVGVYFYCLPSYTQARKVIWDSINNDGQRFLDYIPQEAIARTNSQEMKITLINGSIIQLIGSDNIDSIVGSNPRGCVFSEYAMQSELAYQLLRPIFIANGGWTVFVSTPRGHNHFYDLYQAAKKNKKDWFFSFLSIVDTQHISEVEVQKEIEEGLMSYDLSRQEYYCDFDMGAIGSYYSKYIDKMRRDGRIGDVLYDPSLPVHTAWDLGLDDMTAVIFFQVARGNTIHIIDFFEVNNESLTANIRKVKDKPYIYGFHVGPHDVRQREQTNNTARWETARALGFTFKVAPGVEEKVYVADGIEAVRILLPRVFIDQVRCKTLIRHLENYRCEYDAKKKTYKTSPAKDCHCHSADAMRYLATSLHLLNTGMTQEDVNRAKLRARQGKMKDLPRAFR